MEERPTPPSRNQYNGTNWALSSCINENPGRRTLSAKRSKERLPIRHTAPILRQLGSSHNNRYPRKRMEIIFNSQFSIFQFANPLKRQKIMKRVNNNGTTAAKVNNESKKIRKSYAELKEAARQQAIEWQDWLSDHSVSYEGLAIASEHFENLGRRFGLLGEFRENAII